LAQTSGFEVSQYFFDSQKFYTNSLWKPIWQNAGILPANPNTGKMLAFPTNEIYDPSLWFN
jgi:hypothetical protein